MGVTITAIRATRTPSSTSTAGCPLFSFFKVAYSHYHKKGNQQCAYNDCTYILRKPLKHDYLLSCPANFSDCKALASFFANALQRMHSAVLRILDRLAIELYSLCKYCCFAVFLNKEHIEDESKHQRCCNQADYAVFTKEQGTELVNYE